MYHFVTGFTAKIPGTEVGVTEPTPTFSSLFGEPFMPLDPMVYAKMLGERIADGRTRVYLVNTGWIGGGYGVGHRIELAYTRAWSLAPSTAPSRTASLCTTISLMSTFPLRATVCPTASRCRASTGRAPRATTRPRTTLAVMFEENFEKKYSHLPESVKAAGPHAQVSAEARHRGRGLLGLRH